MKLKDDVKNIFHAVGYMVMLPIFEIANDILQAMKKEEERSRK